MERSGGYGQSMTHSFSLPSLVEGSEPISEADEFAEMKSLRESGDKALEVKDYTGAIKYYNEALEIDEHNPDVLLARAVACMEMGDYISAQRDTEFLVGQDAENAQAHKVHGIATKFLHQYKEALASFLTALELDPDNSDEITDFIADVAAQFCNIPEDMQMSLKEMDSYKKLSEVGVCLFQSKKYKICIKILNAAQKFQTNQKGITMRILLTSANAHSALKHTEKAISLYQDCLTTAIATHDQIYQTKALVNIATLYLENHDTHQAIIFYEKLLHLKAELVLETGNDEDNLPDFWTRELQCGLHLNLSIAYKAIGDMVAAIKHAQQYVGYIEKYGFEGKLKAESYHNSGMLSEVLGKYNDAINNYNKYLKECKGNGDKKGMAQAYGCLGSVYAALRNWKLAITYHEQYVAMARKFDDKRMKIIANEMLADTLMLRGDFETAVKVYETMINSCIRTDYRSLATGMCKMGHAYKALNKPENSVQFYQQAAELAEDFEFPEIQTMCYYNIASIQQKSSKLLELENALKYYHELVPYYESKLREHSAENTHCPTEYHTQLQECYDGIQTVHAKLGNKEECLQFAEAYRKRVLTQTHNYQASAMTSQSHTAPWDVWTVERIGRIVGQQSSTVLYYSLTAEYLLLWVLQPGAGLVRFYNRRASGPLNMIETVEAMIEEIREGCDWSALGTQSENRALPLRNAELELIRRRNLKLSKAPAADEEAKVEEKSPSKVKVKSLSDVKSESKIKYEDNSQPTTENEKSDVTCRSNVAKKGSEISEGTSKSDTDVLKPKKTVQRRLYDLLFSPVEDILSKLPQDNPLIIVPDKALHHCPFNLVQDFLDRYAYERFKITYLPNLLLLDKVVANELNTLRALDDLEFERQIHRHGAVMSHTQRYGGSSGSVSVNSGSIITDVSPRKVAHPRLLTRPMVPPKPGQLLKQGTLCEEDFKKHSQFFKSPRTPKGIAESFHSSLNTPNSASPMSHIMERMYNTGNFTTLTTRTSTGTDITTSQNTVTQFKQVSCQDRCLVFANPRLPHCLKLHGKLWMPNHPQLLSAKREAKFVGAMLDVDPIMGLDATKQTFLKEIERASVIHIATYGCWEEGLIVMSPSPVDAGEGIPREESYLVTADDILGLKLNAKLVVLNLGYDPNKKDAVASGFLIPNALIAAGAQCVVFHAWPLPDACVQKFYYSFYMALQKGNMVSSAIIEGINTLSEDERFQTPFFWSGFLVVGKDAYVNINKIRHAQLDQKLDKTEEDVEDFVGRRFLNPKPALSPIKKKPENLKTLQTYLCTLLHYHAEQPTCIPELIDLLDSSLKRLHTDDNNKQTTLLSDEVMEAKGAVDLLKFLGFHFQAKGAALTNPYVVYPHWNKDELLIPTYDALRSLLDICENLEVVQAVCTVLPITQDNISLIVDLLSVTRHAPEIQLKVSDLSVRPLWINIKLKKLLLSCGFHQIGMLLNFNRTPHNRRMMLGVFQLLLAVSQAKSQVLLYRLDVNLLGTSSEAKSSVDYPELIRLPSLAPLMLPRNQLSMSTPWLSKAESQLEMEEKVRLARSKTDLEENFKDYLDRAKTWHQMTVVAQAKDSMTDLVLANESLNNYGRPKTTPPKVKVLPGATSSFDRVPIDQKIVLRNTAVDQRREYAHYIYQERLRNIDHRRRDEMLKLYLPYVNTC